MQLEYKISGVSNNETILFVHGAGANLRQFEHQHAFFADRYKVVSVSLRGHGGSPSPSQNTAVLYSLEQLAGDIIELIEQLKLDHIHYVGNSAGGVIGFIVCARKEKQFLSLTSFGTTGHMRFPVWTAPLISGFDAFMIKYFRRLYLSSTAGYAVKSKESKNKVLHMFLQAADAIPHLRANLVNYNFLDTIKQLSIPYNLIQCEYDKDINKALKTTLEAMSKNKKSRVVQLKGAGHIANLDEPDAFNQVLLELIETSNLQRV